MEREIFTIGEVAALLGAPVHRVTNIVNTRAHIKPADRIGNLRVYSRDTIALIRAELAAIDRRYASGRFSSSEAVTR